MSQKELNSPNRFSLPNSYRDKRIVVRLNNVGKRYNRDWIFRHCNYSFTSGVSYAITGANGSGKSTLLQVIAGAILHNEGTVDYFEDAESPIADKKTASANIHHPASGIQTYRYLSIAAPYLDLVEEMTAKETIEFHARFKSMIPGFSFADILQTVGLENATDKQLRYFSSGMKQRLKLALAFFSNTPVLLLDEPTTNLDADGVALYHQLFSNYTKDKLVIISSTVKQEYEFCEEVIEISKFKST